MDLVIELLEKQAELNKVVGEKLKAKRLAIGASQEDVAFNAGFDQSALSKLERFGPQAVSIRKLQDLANSLGLLVTIEFKTEDEIEDC